MTILKYFFWGIWIFLAFSLFSCARTSSYTTHKNATPIGPVSSPTAYLMTATGNDQGEVDRNFLRAEGWPLPDLRKWVKTKPSSPTSRQRSVVVETNYEPKVPDSYILSFQDDGSHEAWNIYLLKEINLADRIYGYVMVGAKVILDADGKVKYRVATSRGIQVYDNDGDGIFETAKFSGLNEPLPKIAN